MKPLTLVFIFIGVAKAAPDFLLSLNNKSDKITPELQIALKQKGSTNVFVTMQEDTSQILDYITSARFSRREDRLNSMHTLLLDLANRSQKNLVKYLSSVGNVKFESFWINNQLFIQNADTDLVEQLALFPEVKSIDEEFFATLIESIIEDTNITKADKYEWGILKVQAPEAWDHLGGDSGRGVRVGTIDTGVRVTHEALRDNFMGEYGWYDPSTREVAPTDNTGHGTHVTGIIAGKNGIGVAPGSTWMACRGCATSSCSQYDLNQCGQFFACPTLTDGSKPDCSKAPHVVSNSWGGGRGATWYEPVIEAWKVVGIIPVFSIGNHGPNCNTANSPGDNRNVIGVGSTMESDAISSFSSIGPTSDGRMKPDISAPGSAVVSSYHLADNAYRALSGTSMAAPHVSGTIVLLLTRDSSLSIAAVRQLLFGNTDRELEFSGKVCENVEDKIFPNHVFGNGRLNALKSISAQTSEFKIQK